MAANGFQSRVVTTKSRCFWLIRKNAGRSLAFAGLIMSAMRTLASRRAPGGSAASSAAANARSAFDSKVRQLRELGLMPGGGRRELRNAPPRGQLPGHGRPSCTSHNVYYVILYVGDRPFPG